MDLGSRLVCSRARRQRAWLRSPAETGNSHWIADPPGSALCPGSRDVAPLGHFHKEPRSPHWLHFILKEEGLPSAPPDHQSPDWLQLDPNGKLQLHASRMTTAEVNPHMQGNPSPTPSPCHICPSHSSIKNHDNKPPICTLKSLVKGQEAASLSYSLNTFSYFPTSFF